MSTSREDSGVPTDDEILTANARGMDACDNGETSLDNPYANRELRIAWHDGWVHANTRRGTAPCIER